MLNGNRIHFITKNFAHHSSFSGYDRLLDFVPHSAPLLLPASRFVKAETKEKMIQECLAKWDHYGIAEVDMEINLRASYFLRQHIFHFIYGENTFCYAADFNRKNKAYIATYHQPE